MRRAPASPLALLLLLLLLPIAPATTSCRGGDASGPPPEGLVEIRGSTIPVEVADSAAEQEKGLGGRDGLAWGTGMYFPYAKPRFVAFWMKGMRFAIDIVYLRDGRIVEIHPQVPFDPRSNGPTIRARSLVDAVLEVPAGQAAAGGWQVGDRVRFERVRAE